MRSAVVSATGRTPLGRVNTNVIMTAMNNMPGFRGGDSIKGVGGRPAYGGRK